MNECDFKWTADGALDDEDFLFEDLGRHLTKKNAAEAYGKPTCWAIGSLTIFIMLAIDASLLRIPHSPLCESATALLAITAGLMLLGAAACASDTLKTWAQNNSEYLLPLSAMLLVLPLMFSAALDLFFGLSATSWLCAWRLALVMGLISTFLALCSGNEIKLLEVSIAALASFGGSVLLWLIFGSLFLIAIILSLVIAACLILLWDKYIPLNEFLFDDETELDSECESVDDIEPNSPSKEDEAS